MRTITQPRAPLLGRSLDDNDANDRALLDELMPITYNAFNRNGRVAP